ncbi:MAG: NPN-dependent hydroxyacid isomerase, LarAH14/15/16 family [Mycobacteriales bacterium]
MSRPGFVLEVDERTPPLVVHEGEGFRLQSFPLGTRVVYPPQPLPGLDDVDAAIKQALLNPLGCEPLPQLLRPGMRLTIAFDDISLPLPPMRRPDVRQRVIEAVLGLAADAGVDDVEIIAANALHRRMTPTELEAIVGERVFRSFYPSGCLYNHDAEDPNRLALVGTTDAGEEVELNRRAVESDLLVYVNINLVAMDGGHKSVPIGLASYRSLRHHHNSQTMMHSTSFMDPRHSALHSSAGRMGRLLADQLKIFTIETTLNNDCFPAPYQFLVKREWEWSLRDQTAMLAARRALAAAPTGLRRKVFAGLRAPYQLTGVTAGETEAVHEQTLQLVHRQQLTEINGQADVLVLGVPYLSPYNVNSVMNPVLAACLGLGYLFNSYRGVPLVRRGGAVILYHPVRYEFSQLHHPSYVDFFEEVLAETTDPATLEAKFERQYATDPWYIHLYRTSYAYHGVHPFYMWYWIAHALDHVGEVVWVGADRRTVGRMGFRAASTFADALEMVRGCVGSAPSITYLHSPPHTIAEVR